MMRDRVTRGLLETLRRPAWYGLLSLLFVATIPWAAVAQVPETVLFNDNFNTDPLTKPPVQFPAGPPAGDFIEIFGVNGTTNKITVESDIDIGNPFAFFISDGESTPILIANIDPAFGTVNTGIATVEWQSFAGTACTDSAAAEVRDAFRVEYRCIDGVPEIWATDRPSNVAPTGVSYTAGVFQTFRAVLNLNPSVPSDKTFDLFINGVAVRTGVFFRGEWVSLETFSFGIVGSAGGGENFGLDNVRIAHDTAPPATAFTVDEGQLLEFTASGGGVDTGIEVRDLPRGATFDPDTRRFAWTPGADQAGRYFVTFVFTTVIGDIVRTFSREVVITVNDTIVDTDGDGYPDAADNCPTIANNQSDLDGDGIGDVCDPTPLPPGVTGGASTASSLISPPPGGFFLVGADIPVHACVTLNPGPSPYFAVRPQAERLVVEVRDALGNLVPPTQVQDPPLLILPDDLVEITTTPQTLCVDLLVNDRYDLKPGKFTVITRYITIGVRDLSLSNAGVCTTGPGDCYEPILQTNSPAAVLNVTIKDLNGADGQITNLITFINGLSDRGLRSSLIAKLRAAQAALRRGDLGAACNILQAFLSEVSAQAGKKLTTAQATFLTDAVNAIRAALVCTS